MDISLQPDSTGFPRPASSEKAESHDRLTAPPFSPPTAKDPEQRVQAPASDLDFTVKRLQEEIRERKSAQETLQLLNDELELRVRERTAQLEDLNRRLAMDIQERTRIQASIQRSEERYRQLTESSPDAIFITDREGNLRFVNRTASLMAGESPEALVGRRQEDIFPPEIAAIHRENVRLVINQQPAPMIEEQIVMAGQTHWIDTRLVPLKDESGQITEVLGLTQVITQRKEMENALRESEARLRALLKAMPDLMFILDREGRFLDFHAANSEQMLLTPEQFLDRKVSELLPRSLADKFLQNIHQALVTNQIQVQEYNLVVGGETRHYEARIVAYAQDKACAIVRDISDTRRLEQEILEVCQKERRRLGQDFHDSLGQNLVALAFLSKALRQQLAASGRPETAQAEEIENLANQITGQASGLARGLSPLEPAAEGLMHALRELADNVTQVFNVPCRFVCNQPVLIHEDYIAVHLYYLAQEAVNNAIKHAQPRQIDLSLRNDAGNLILEIADNGLGLPSDVSQRRGLGLRTMAFRARVLGGTLDLHPPPSGGTLVRCSVPNFPSMP
ncbi:MAG TPA: PAS domain S-box protein [Candidatus Paceibacterota bacterium]|nr:PAS domain S-box protein [Verrucomicrobiota bacterium]HRY46898.1 PAS domain S-box protein [Candidatus Paceibacterota bacterium]HSA01051.1 PAS domain S-box protein [Candidatus Paceibacterota bacterium]